MSRRRRHVAFRDYIPLDIHAMAKINTNVIAVTFFVISQEFEEDGGRSRRHSSPINSREGSTTALHTQHYDDTSDVPTQ
ncbi:unnamed protein product [Euphydryas editha]|nr:unnamed protein product [Euphydryas editha]